MTPTPADEALAREILRAWYSFSKNQSPEFQKELEKTFAKDLDAAAQLIAAHVAAQAPSGLVGLPNLERALRDAYVDFEEIFHAAGGSVGGTKTLVEARAKITTVLSAHKAHPVADVRGMVEAVKEYDVQMAAIGGCCDGYCYVTGKAKGMHTNGGCQCLREDRYKGVRVAGAARKLRDTVAALASARHAMGREVKV